MENLASNNEVMHIFRAGRFICLLRLSLDVPEKNWAQIIDFGGNDDYAQNFSLSLAEPLTSKFFGLYKETLSLSALECIEYELTDNE